MKPRADDGGVGHAGLRLLRLEPLGVGDAVLEPERVARPQVGEPLLEAVLVEQLRDAVAGRQVEVVVALGADVEPGLDFLAEDGGLALRAADPQPFRHAALGRSVPSRRHAGLSQIRQIRDREIRIAALDGSFAIADLTSDVCESDLYASSICARTRNVLPSTYARNAPPPVETCVILRVEAELLDRLRRLAAADHGDAPARRHRLGDALACPR